MSEHKSSTDRNSEDQLSKVAGHRRPEWSTVDSGSRFDDPHVQNADIEHERRRREAGLDDTLSQTFPASDPPSSIPNPLI